MRSILVAVLFFAIPAFPQSANVIALSADDTTRVKKAWDALQKAQKDWDDTRESITNGYLVAPSDKESGCMSPTPIKKGWGCGDFDFSKDFRFIVPKEKIIVPNYQSTPGFVFN